MRKIMYTLFSVDSSPPSQNVCMNIIEYIVTYVLTIAISKNAGQLVSSWLAIAIANFLAFWYLHKVCAHS